MSSVQAVIEKHIRDNGFDGLYNEDGQCACEMGQLFPCDGDFRDCKFGYKKIGDDPDFEFFIVKDRPEI